MVDERLVEILSGMTSRGYSTRAPKRVCQVAAEVIDVSGIGITVMANDVPHGSLCATDRVSALIEELQYTLGEGPCVDSYHLRQTVLEPNLVDPRTPRWFAFGPRAVEAGVKAVFAFPLEMGSVRLGALDLYRDRPGPLSDGQYSDALLIANVMATWVLDVQADAPPGVVARALVEEGEFHFAVHTAAGKVSVQLGISVTDALIRLRAYAFSSGRMLHDVAQDVVEGNLRFG